MLGRQIAVGFGIAVIFPMMVYYGVSTFFLPPKPMEVPPPYTVAPNATPEERQKQLNDQREEQRQKKEAYDSAAKGFAHHLVVISTPLGVAAILIGAYLALHAIGTGLIFGGIFTVSWGYWNYWSYLEDWMRFVSLLMGFAILLFVGFRRTTALQK